MSQRGDLEKEQISVTYEIDGLIVANILRILLCLHCGGGQRE